MVVELSFSDGWLIASNLPTKFRETAEFDVEAGQFSPRVPWEWHSRTKAWRVPAMHYASAVRELEAGEVDWIDAVAKWQTIQWPALELPSLRKDQDSAIAAWEPSKQGYLVMATGTGKTEVALAIMAKAQVSTLIVVPVCDLMHQWRHRVRSRTGYESGVVGDSIRDVRPVTVTTYESASLHMRSLGNQFGLIIFDECHHLPGTNRQIAARHSAAPFRLGLTATPGEAERQQQTLEQLVGPPRFRFGIRDAAGEVLANYRVVRMPVELDSDERSEYELNAKIIREFMASQRHRLPGYQWEQVYRDANRNHAARQALQAFRRKRRIEDHAAAKFRTLEELFRMHAGEPVIVFAGSNSMAREISRRFLIPCLLSHCRKDERRDIIDGIRSGDYPALVANQVLDEGMDLPEVNVAIVVGGTSSPRQATQRLGRILRKNRHGDAVLYEVVSMDTGEIQRSRSRRRSDAFKRTLAG